MRKTALALIAATTIAAICAAPAAQAFATRGSGPTESNKGTYRDGGAPGAPSGTNSGAPSTSVPEPGTLVLLAAGVTAIGGAALRRKRAAKKSK